MELALILVIVTSLLAYAGSLWEGDKPLPRVPGPTLEVPALSTAAPPTPGMISYDALVQHYVVVGVETGRTLDSRPPNQPLAPTAPVPVLTKLDDVLSHLPTFSVPQVTAG